ncbi:hypothetical protein ACFFUT_12460 [Pseudohalocynthiibacter aestuariivivens]|uniref:Uncharacterized protein n=1 Tax=Pseudohalocynthiibacter aestuariivivens TaxID=1591409 RepID=A0ABV5JGU1_9RHOB|nr:hypothetical protein [Pseudohalocynthiibacter aestuariivivens]MBS9718965.1 hypothetical protein [Pseudohalocynthiibacter aestuariivivens]
MRRILAAEFRNYARALKQNLEATPPIDEFVSVGRVNRIFSEQLAADLGLLDLDEIDIVVNALISLDGMDRYLENISPHASETRFLVPANAWDDFRKINSTTADALDCAIQVLELSGQA